MVLIDLTILNFFFGRETVDGFLDYVKGVVALVLQYFGVVRFDCCVLPSAIAKLSPIAT